MKKIIILLTTFLLFIANYSNIYAICGTYNVQNKFCVFSDGTVTNDFANCGNSKCCTSSNECTQKQNTQPVQQSTNSAATSPTCEVDGKKGISTALGCLPFEDPDKLAVLFLRIGLGIGGGIAFLMIIFAGFIISTSSGDPKRLNSGKELLGAAIGGLILLIFSVFILRLLGVNILGIFPSK